MKIKCLKPQNHKLAQAVMLAIAALATNQAQATNYNFSWVGGSPIVFNPGAGSANSVNDSGLTLSPQLAGKDAPSGIWNGNIWTALDSPVGGIATALKLNNGGQSSGIVKYDAEDVRPTRWDGTTATELPRLNGFYGEGSDINNSGQIAGYSWADVHFHAVRWDPDNSIYDLGTLGGTFSRASGINDAGYIVGTSFTANGDAQHATLWKPDGTVVDLDNSGSSYSWAVDINNAGQIAGYSMDAKGLMHVTEWNVDGTIAPIDILGGYSGSDMDTYIIERVASPINNAGQIVGSLSYYDGIHKDYAFLWENGNLIDLNTLLSPTDAANGIYLDWALGINDKGAIWGSAHQGNLSGSFVLSPAAVPIPGAVWLFGSALAGLLGVKTRKFSFVS